MACSIRHHDTCIGRRGVAWRGVGNSGETLIDSYHLNNASSADAIKRFYSKWYSFILYITNNTATSGFTRVFRFSSVFQSFYLTCAGQGLRLNFEPRPAVQLG